jgi:hypothetical protein
MKTYKKPEERELDAKKQELNRLEEILFTEEIELSTLQGKMASFQNMYVRIVGIKLSELDSIEAKISEILVNRYPADKNLQDKAEETRSQAQDSSFANEFEVASASVNIFHPDENLKALFREVAKLIHPDLADDDEEIKLREELMKKANKAYQEGDIEMLESIISEWETSPEQIGGRGIGADLIRLIRKIEQVNNRISTIDKELHNLHNTDLFKLMSKVELGENMGDDILRQMADNIGGQIELANTRLSNLLAT